MEKQHLSAAIGFRLWREGLAREQGQAERFVLDFAEVSPIHRAFAPMAREQCFDVSEMAIVTALQALAYGKPLLLLPVTLAARFQHGCLIALATRGLRVSDLAGKRIGVRAYTQTTGVWVRGILENDYGVKASEITWITQEGAHLAEFQDPPWVTRVDHDRALVDMLRDGEIDAAILGNDLPDDPDLAPVIANPKATAAAWFAAHGVVPTNHVMVVRRDIAEAAPETIRELWRIMHRARPIAIDGPDLAAIGIEAHRPALNLLLAYCAQQRLLPRKLTVDEAFADTLAVLGPDLRN